MSAASRIERGAATDGGVARRREEVYRAASWPPRYSHTDDEDDSAVLPRRGAGSLGASELQVRYMGIGIVELLSSGDG